MLCDSKGGTRGPARCGAERSGCFVRLAVSPCLLTSSKAHLCHAKALVAASCSGGRVRDTTRTRLSRPFGPGPVPLIYLSIEVGVVHGAWSLGKKKSSTRDPCCSLCPRWRRARTLQCVATSFAARASMAIVARLPTLRTHVRSNRNGNRHPHRRRERPSNQNTECSALE